mmetsp:Transcript_148507/g.458895  ORF Transcript_148507/g.458895 Transcript_148507/m.458895 type:complete len:367 (+) Transcript_148507:101-1201(+)
MLGAFDDDELDRQLEEEAAQRAARQAAGHGCPKVPPLPGPEVLAGGRFEPDGEDAEAGWVDLRGTPIGIRFRVILIGPADAPLLVYVPGTLTDFRKGADRRPLQALARRFRVLSLDLRNCGRSRPCTWERAGGRGGFSHAGSYADDVVAVASAVFGIDSKFHLVGFSSGANIALWAAHRHPDRVLRMANVAGGFFANREEEFMGDDLEDWDRVLGAEDIVWFRAMTNFEPSLEERSRRLLGLVNANFGEDWQAKNPSATENLVQVLAAEERALEETEGYSREALIMGACHAEVANFICGSPPAQGLAALGGRTLVVGGRHDGMHRPHRFETLHRKMPGSRLEWFSDGHAVLPVASDAIARHLLADP